MNQITINLELCDADGYKVQYRKLGSSDAFVALPDTYTGTPIIFTDSTYPDGTEFEGYVTSICGASIGNPVPFSTAEVETTWGGINAFCEVVRSCADGYTLSDDQSVCTRQSTTEATPPSGGGSPGVAEAEVSAEWNKGGARIYLPGYPVSGEGVLDYYLTQAHLFVNGDAPFDGMSNTTWGRMNAAGVWIVGGAPINEYIGFSRKVTLASAKTVYIAMSADNAFRFTVNGNVLVDCTTGNIAGGPNFNFLHIYPVDLLAGDNFIEMYGVNFGSVAGMVAEIYDNTRAELITATSDADLTILFSTSSMPGEPFDLGETVGYSCPVSYSYDPDSGLCVKIETNAPTVTNTGMLAYEDRERLIDGVPDGYQEPNTDGGGIGDYVPPVENLGVCPI